MERQLDAYCEHLRSERQVSPHTLSAYRRDLDKVLGWCIKQNIGSWAALDIQRLRSLIARLHAQGQSSRSLARLLSAVRGLYHYLNREGLCEHDPATGLAPPKGERRLPKTLDTDRALQLLEGAVEDDFLARRDQAILELFYSSGLRLSELTGLNLDQLDLADGMVQVLGKGSKTRLLPVGKKAREALEQWLPLRAMTNPADDAVFVSQQGRRLGPRAIQVRVKLAGERELGRTCTRTCCGTPSPATCWNPRRTCARCRNCSATRTSRPRRSTPTWTSSTWRRSTTAPTPGPNAAKATIHEHPVDHLRPRRHPVDTAPVIVSAEAVLREWLSEHAPNLGAVPVEHLWAIRERVLNREPGLKHRISALRRRVLFHALEDAGYAHGEASDLADKSFEVFLQARHQISVFPEVEPTLEILANHYALGVVTNGNADVRRLGLADYFKFALCAEDIGIAKPDARLFHEALQRGGVSAEAAVHIGDHPGDDIAGRSRRACARSGSTRRARSGKRSGCRMPRFVA